MSKKMIEMPYYPIVSNGKSHDDLIRFLTNKGFTLNSEVREAMSAPTFTPTNKTYQVIILGGGKVFPEKSNRTSRDILACAKEHTFSLLSIEIACLLALAFSKKEIKSRGFSALAVFCRQAAASSETSLTVESTTNDLSLLVVDWISKPRISFERIGSHQSRRGWQQRFGFPFLVK